VPSISVHDTVYLGADLNDHSEDNTFGCYGSWGEGDMCRLGFGDALAYSSNPKRLFVGCPGCANSTGTHTGKIYAFTYDSGLVEDWSWAPADSSGHTFKYVGDSIGIGDFDDDGYKETVTSMLDCLSTTYYCMNNVQTLEVFDSYPSMGSSPDYTVTMKDTSGMWYETNTYGNPYLSPPPRLHCGNFNGDDYDDCFVGIPWWGPPGIQIQRHPSYDIAGGGQVLVVPGSTSGLAH
jgi:hypothetical protein